MQNQYHEDLLEAGLDEAGRGCLAGPVVAAAVILPPDYTHPVLNDSKQLTHKKRMLIREDIYDQAIAWAVGIISPERIDEVNILNASFDAMIQAVEALKITPAYLLVDGNRFRPRHLQIPYRCEIKGDGRFRNIAAASILAKTHRDEIMESLDQDYPEYHWASNKGYPTQQHREAIWAHGITEHHRKSFNAAKPLTLFDP